MPHLSGRTAVRDVTVELDGERVPATLIEQHLDRVYVGEAALLLEYPFSRTRRFEAAAGYRMLRFDADIERIIAIDGEVVNRETFDARAPGALHFVQISAAFVGDYSFFGPTSPVQGGRYRFEVAPIFGDLRYQTVLGDYRRYFFARPLTLAARGIFYGRFGRDAESQRLFPLFVGSPALVRGYDAGSFDAAECTEVADDGTACPEFDRLIGSRLAVANLELRIPLLGPDALALIALPALPLEISPFVDAGVAWTSDESPELRFDRVTSDRVPVVGAGVSARLNLFGYAVVEFFYAKPLHRRAKNWVFGFQLAPGW